MHCKFYQAEVEETNFDGDGLSAAVRAHVRECPTCRKHYEQRVSLHGLLGSLARVSAPADFEFRLRARMASHAGMGNRTKALHRFFAPRTISVTLAACFILMVAFGVSRINRGEIKDPQAKSSATLKPTLKEVAQSEEQIENELLNSQITSIEIRSEHRAVKEQRRGLAARATTLNLRGARNSSRLERVATKRSPDAAHDDRDVSVSPAPVVTRDSAPVAPLNTNLNPPLAVSVGDSSEALKVVLQDERGTTQVVPVERVSFGAQDIVSRPQAPTPRTSQPLREGIW